MEAFLLRREIIAQDARNQPCNGVYHHHGGEFSAGKDIIAYGYVVSNGFLQHTFIDTFVVPADKDKFIFFRQFFRLCLGKGNSLWGYIDRPDFLPAGHSFMCIINGLGLHKHTGSAAIRIIIRLSMSVCAVVPDIDRIQ